MSRALAAVIAAAAASGCESPLPCGGAEVSAGNWRMLSLQTPSQQPRVALTRGTEALPFLLDTGFRRSALGPAALEAEKASPSTPWLLGDVRVRADFSAITSTPSDGVLGAEVLELVPLTWDPSTGTLETDRTFVPASTSDVTLRRHELGDCADPGVAWTLEASLEGRRRTWLLDTGATFSVIRTELAAALAGQPGLGGLRLETAFAGVVAARAHRASRLELGSAETYQPVVLSGVALDAELDRQSDWLTRAAGETVRVDGLLGWNVLREGRGGWTGTARGPAQALRFTPYAVSPWPRDFLGVGVALRPVQGGLEVVSVYEPSPAQQAGITAGDLLLSVEDIPAASAPSPFAPVGTAVTLQLRRQGATFERRVAVVDLLPDAPAQ